MATSTVLLNVVLAGFVLFLIKRFFDRKPSAPMPPGPKGLPIVGNLFDLPRKDEYTVFGEWHKKYGPISSATVFGRSIIVLNTPKVATEMLAKKAGIYSDRPYFTMAGDLVGWKDVIVLLPYKARFKAYRKMMHQVLGSRANILKFREHIESETQKAMRRLLDEPENFVGVVRKAIGYIVLLVTYGYKCTSEHDPIVRVADEATTQLGILLAAGGFLVDRLPFLRHIPDWIPGAHFKALAREWRECLYSLTNWTYDYTLAQMSAGSSPPNFVANLLESGPRSDEEKHNIKWAASSLYSGGADTPVTTLSVFFLAMAKYPEAMKKAQAEIDAIIGNDRLPTFDDRDKLPYVNALAKEVIRWGPTAPLGAPHCVSQDDVHEGYFIPKGSVLVANLWHFLHDPDVYKDPWTFNPDRLVASEGRPAEQDPYELCFGYGRRSCPGAHLADAVMYIFAAVTLSVYNIGKAIDEHGAEIEPEFAFTSGALIRPKEFQCSIKPRSAKAEALIRTIEL